MSRETQERWLLPLAALITLVIGGAWLYSFYVTWLIWHGLYQALMGSVS